MIDFIIRWSLANRLAVVLASGLLLIAGAYAATVMPVDVFPDLTAPTVTVVVEGRGMAPEEMETLVTFPIETAVNGAASVRRVRSATAVGITVVWVEFDWGTDLYRARQTVTERLANVTGSLPPEVKPPVLAPISSIMGEILFISLTSDRHSPLELHTTASNQIRRRLLSVAGVAQVTPIGGDEKQYHVVLSPDRLRAYQMPVAEVAAVLGRTNENVSAGFLVQAQQEYLIQGIGRIKNAEDIGDTVVSVRNGKPIRVSDLGSVAVGAAIKRGTGAASRRSSKWEPIIEPAVIIAIQKQPGTNTLTITEQLDAALSDIQASLPEGMFINRNLFRQANFIKASLDNTIEALRDGGIMVIVVVLVFLASIRSSLITLLAIPISLAVTLLILWKFGGSINTMTLGGMAIAIGALVDDAIIDVENVVRRLRENMKLPADQQRPEREVIYKASIEVRASIVFATLIILLVFLPIFALSGVEGRLLRPLGIAFTVSLAASLVTALMLTPALCSYLLPRSKAVRNGAEAWIVRFLKRLYSPVLNLALNRAWLIALPAGAALAAALFGIQFMGHTFLPEFNEGALVVGLVTVPGTSLQQSDEMAHRVEQALMSHPEIAAIGRRTGRAEEDEHVQGVEASEIDLTLDMDAPLRLGKSRRTKKQLLEALRNDLAAIPGVQATFGQPIGHRIDHMLSGTRAGIAVKLFGEDLGELRTLGRRIENFMRDIPGIVDLSTEQQVDIPILRVEFDRDAIARYGLQIADVAGSLELAFSGKTLTQVLEGQNAFDLVVRTGRSDSAGIASPEDAGEILVDSPDGTRIPMKALARISEERGPNLISRENVQRKIVVMCNVADRDIGTVVDDIRETIRKNIKLPQGYYIQYGGQFESAEETQRLLGVLGVCVVLGIGFLLHIVFGSMRDSFLIMVNLPLALIGGVAGVFLSGGSLSVASLIGFITVFGIATRNGIMMISHIGHLQQHEGVTDFREAVFRGAMERLAPILMTALAAGLALVPLALSQDKPGNEILRPMAMVILFGLLSSTFFNMLVIPALYLRFGRKTPLLC